MASITYRMKYQRGYWAETWPMSMNTKLAMTDIIHIVNGIRVDRKFLDLDEYTTEEELNTVIEVLKHVLSDLEKWERYADCIVINKAINKLNNDIKCTLKNIRKER